MVSKNFVLLAILPKIQRCTIKQNMLYAVKYKKALYIIITGTLKIFKVIKLDSAHFVFIIYLIFILALGKRIKFRVSNTR